MTLKIVQSPTAQDSVSFAPRTIGRFGEMREALSLGHLDELRVFTAEAARRSLPVELAVGFALERQLILKDLEGAGFEAGEVQQMLAGAARAAAPPQLELGPGRLNSAYVRLLGRVTRGRSAAIHRESRLVTIPARLCDRLSEVDLATALDVTALNEMVAWEIAAVVSGRTMSEWALHTLLAARLTSSSRD